MKNEKKKWLFFLSMMTTAGVFSVTGKLNSG